MLQAVQEPVHTGYEEPGTRLRDAASLLHDAIGRMESALERRREAVRELPEGELNALEKENDVLKKQLQQSQAQHHALDGQVKDISRRLELLIDRVGKLLAE